MPSIGHWRKILNIRRQDDDKQLNAIILAKLDNEHVYVQVSADMPTRLSEITRSAGRPGQAVEARVVDPSPSAVGASVRA